MQNLSANSEDHLLLILNSIFSRVFGRSISLSLRTHASDIPDWDSIYQIKLIIAIEEKFSLRFHLGEVEATECIDDLVKLIQRHLGSCAK